MSGNVSGKLLILRTLGMIDDNGSLHACQRVHDTVVRASVFVYLRLSGGTTTEKRCRIIHKTFDVLLSDDEVVRS